MCDFGDCEKADLLNDANFEEQCKQKRRHFEYVPRRPRGSEYVDVEALQCWMREGPSFGMFQGGMSFLILIRRHFRISLSILYKSK